MVGPKKDESVVTPAAYLLFYRRQSTATLGGPFFDRILSVTRESPSASQTNSRAASPSAPSGEGKRLDDSSRNGSSSALRGVGAAHQAGGGGPVGQAVMTMRMDDDDELPPYSAVDMADLSHRPNESMDVDDEGIGGMEDATHIGGGGLPYGPNWSFDHLEENLGTRRIPPNSEDDDLESVQATGSDRDDRMDDFKEDEGTTMQIFGTPTEDRVGAEIPWQTTEYEDEPLAEVRVDPLGEEEDELKMH